MDHVISTEISGPHLTSDIFSLPEKKIFEQTQKEKHNLILTLLTTNYSTFMTSESVKPNKYRDVVKVDRE